MSKKNPRQQRRLADMSLPPEQRGRRGRGRRRKLIGGTPPAQLDHAGSPKARRHQREGEAAMRRWRSR